MVVLACGYGGAVGSWIFFFIFGGEFNTYCLNCCPLPVFAWAAVTLDTSTAAKELKTVHGE